jgi:hypothetical protein
MYVSPLGGEYVPDPDVKVWYVGKDTTACGVGMRP